MKNSPDDNLAVPKDFPYHEEVSKRYFIDNSNRPDDVIRLLEHPRQFCCGGEIRPIPGILRGIAVITAIAALIVSLAKDFVAKDVAFVLSIIELVLALIAVSTSLGKHSFAWDKVRKQVAKLENAHPADFKTANTQCAIKCPGFFGTILILVWFIFCSCLVMGFVVFHLLDESEHSFLKYTKFSTTLVVFVSWILDSYLGEALSDMTTKLTVDRSIVIIHSIKEELYHELRKYGNNDRIEKWDSYLRSDSTFNAEENGRIFAKLHKNGKVELLAESIGYNQTEQQLADEISEHELLSVVRDFEQVSEKVLKVDFKDKESNKKSPGRPAKGPEKNQEGELLLRKELYESSEAFVVVEMDDIDGKRLLETPEGEDAKSD